MPIYDVWMNYARPGFHRIEADSEKEADKIARALPPPLNGKLSPLHIKKTKARKNVIFKGRLVA